MIQGHFTSASATDWVVLCSRQRRSSILVFHGGEAARVDELSPEPDADRLQAIGSGNIGYSRGIRTASPEYIRAHNPGELLPPLDHDGLHDAFLGKASRIWYWSDDHWLQLRGGDEPMTVFSCDVFSASTSVADLAGRFGTDNVKSELVPWVGGAEGDKTEGTVLFDARSDARLEIYWRDVFNRRDPERVSRQVMGERQFSSGHPAMQELNPAVFEMFLQSDRRPARGR